MPTARALRIGQINPELADMMVHAYLKHLCTNFPIMLSGDILNLHRKRHELDNMYDICILNLIYGLGSHFLETVGCTPCICPYKIKTSGPWNIFGQADVLKDRRSKLWFWSRFLLPDSTELQRTDTPTWRYSFLNLSLASWTIREWRRGFKHEQQPTLTYKLQCYRMPREPGAWWVVFERFRKCGG